MGSLLGRRSLAAPEQACSAKKIPNNYKVKCDKKNQSKCNGEVKCHWADHGECVHLFTSLCEGTKPKHCKKLRIKNKKICEIVNVTPTPSTSPSDAPTNSPTTAPSNAPTGAPTSAPTESPTDAPTNAPTDATTAPCDKCGDGGSGCDAGIEDRVGCGSCTNDNKACTDLAGTGTIGVGSCTDNLLAGKQALMEISETIPVLISAL